MGNESRIIGVVGSSWVGKSSLTFQLVREHHFVRISFGDLLREFVSKTLLNKSSEILTLSELHKELLAQFETSLIIDGQVHLSGTTVDRAARVREEELMSIVANLDAAFFSLYEQAIIELIKKQAQHSPIVFDARDKAVERTLGAGMRPFFVCLTCPTEVRVRRYLSLIKIPASEENFAKYLAILERREHADQVHTPSIKIQDYIHLTLNTAHFSIEEEGDLLHLAAKTYFLHQSNGEMPHKNRRNVS